MHSDWHSIGRRYTHVKIRPNRRGVTTWLMWFPLSYWAQFRRKDISWISSGKQSESTPNNWIREPLALADRIREVSKSCRHLVLQKGDHMSHVVPRLVSGRISKCGYLVQIEWQTIGINAKQQDLAASGLCWDEEGSFKELQKPVIAKGGQMSYVIPPLLLGFGWLKYLVNYNEKIFWNPKPGIGITVVALVFLALETKVLFQLSEFSRFHKLALVTCEKSV